MTSLNAVIIVIKLVISLVVQRILAVSLGETGIAKIGQLRNLTHIITSTSSLGTFNGLVKYVSEYREQKSKLNELFSTAFVFGFVGAILTSLVILFYAIWITNKLFGNLEFLFLIKILALLPPIIGLNRIFQGLINGLSDYKKFAKIELISYLLSTVLLLIFLYKFQLKGVLFSIIITPLIQLGIIIYIFGSIIKKYLQIKFLNFKISFAKELLGYTLMAIVSSILLNYVELDIRTTISNKINVNEAGYWTAMTFISKNYLVFSSSLFALYVIPRFSRINEGHVFRKEVFIIYKIWLPLFGSGMILVYILRNTIINIIYPNFTGLEPLFKWQLLGDFVLLASLVVSHQFLAKKMVKSYVLTELISLALFYFLAKYLVVKYGTEGAVMAHFFRYVFYFVMVVLVVNNYFKIQKKKEVNE